MLVSCSNYTLFTDMCIQMRFFYAALCLLFLMPSPAQADNILTNAMRRGHIRCGTHFGSYAYAIKDEKGTWHGMDVDFCRALAAAALGDANKVKFIDTAGKNRFAYLASDRVDILMGPAPWVLGLDAGQNFNFAGILFFGGQGLMAHWREEASSIEAYKGAKVCVQRNSRTYEYLQEFNKRRRLELRLLVLESFKQAREFFFLKRCDLYANDEGILMGTQTLRNIPSDLNIVILPDKLVETPIGPLVRQDDDRWFDIVKWVRHALIKADEKGVTAYNLDDYLSSPDPEIRNMLGLTDKMWRYLGLDEKWAYRALQAVGNYGEMYNRNLGIGSNVGMENGKNRLWTEGGLIYAPPFY